MNATKRLDMVVEFSSPLDIHELPRYISSNVEPSGIWDKEPPPMQIQVPPHIVDTHSTAEIESATRTEIALTGGLVKNQTHPHKSFSFSLVRRELSKGTTRWKVELSSYDISEKVTYKHGVVHSREFCAALALLNVLPNWRIRSCELVALPCGKPPHPSEYTLDPAEFATKRDFYQKSSKRINHRVSQRKHRIPINE